MNRRNKKILLIAPLPPPFGGIAFITKALLSAGLGEIFQVIHIDTSKGSLTEKFGKITLQDLVLSIKVLLRIIKQCYSDKDISHALILGTNKSAIIRIACYIFILKIFRIKVITNLHGTRFYPKRKGLIRCLNNYVIIKSELILSPTQVDLDGIQSYFLKKANIKLFYNSTFIRDNYNNKIRCKIKTNEFTIIGIGRLSQLKGAFDLISVAIELIKRGSPLKLGWIGRGAFPIDDKYVDKILSENKAVISDRIIIHKDIDDIAKYNLLQQSDLFVLPSYSDNLPISILEAMAFGLPIISTKIGAIPEVITENENGWLFVPGDLVTLKKLIIDKIEKREELLEIGEKNKEVFRVKFSAIQRIKELEKYIG